jgi:protein CpxP
MSRYSFIPSFLSSRTRRIALGAVAATLVAGSLVACGHGPRGEGMGGGMEGMGPMAGMGGMSHGGPRNEADAARHQEQMVEHAAKFLELDAAQKALLTQLGAKMREHHEAMMGQAGKGDPREQFKAVIAGERFDSARAQALVNSHADAMRAGSPQVIAAAAAFYDSLKPAQQQKVREFLDHQRGGMMGHHHPH